jgi:hypothetical protein
MAKKSGYDFPVISDRDAGETRAGPDETEPGKAKSWEETLFQDVEGNWQEGQRGPEIGTLMLREYKTKKPKRVLVRAWFVFDDGDTVEYAGLAPGEGSWKGRGRFGFRGGTGKFADRGGELDVDSTNPKRWG